MNKFNTTEMEWIATTMRRIWLRRNEYVFENKLYSLIGVIQVVNDMISEFNFAQEGLLAKWNTGSSKTSEVV